ncbi:ATP-binding protein [Streptomyces malaysiensis]|uniref:ATP-binding protein n=1 Tax=Streptomyces malaysiensis subsp. samsunensis TaxID=459658 RepID=A0A9X2LV49_STRMQ|nr:ATP-binding protein [Streptomyces samsunensis]MCQ8830031.1 ATP-binding protein [Streptomyces samsunensis]
MTFRHRRTRTITIPARDEHVPLARRAVVDTLRAWGLPEDGEAVYAIRLSSSELLANAVRHACAVTAEITVVVELVDGDRIRVGVHDDHPGRPAPADAAADATSGRGLRIVHMIVGELNGVVFTEHTATRGKTVWAELPCSVREETPVPTAPR